MQTPSIAVIGSYGCGLSMKFHKFPESGETISGGEYFAGPGGKGSNQAIAISRLGVKVSLLTSIGSDEFGQAARALWKREGVDDSCIHVGNRHTGVAFILIDASGENRILVSMGALEELTPEHVQGYRRFMSSAQVLVVSMELAKEAVVKALEVAKDLGVFTILNPAPAFKLDSKIWNLFDVITPNETEAPILLGLPVGQNYQPEQLVQHIREKTNAAIVMTLGANGCLVNEGTKEYLLPAFPVEKIIDTTGAGDCFTAALAVAIAEKQTFIEAVKFASAAGAYCVGVKGVIDAIPTRHDIIKILSKKNY